MSAVQLSLMPEIVPVRVRPEAPPLPVPAGGYGCIVADYPWPYDDDLRTELPYQTMTERELLRFADDIGRAAARDAHLWSWVVDAHLGLACQIIERARFRIVCSVPWIKTVRAYAPRVLYPSEICQDVPRLKIGGGHYLRHAHELCILAVRGSAVPEDRSVPSVIFAPPTEHSAKPEQLQDAAERIAPPGKPMLELFARRARRGWVCWGNEAPTTGGPG